MEYLTSILTPILHCMCVAAIGAIFSSTNVGLNAAKKTMHGTWLDILVCCSGLNVFADPSGCSLQTRDMYYLLSPSTDSSTRSAITGMSCKAAADIFVLLMKLMPPCYRLTASSCSGCRLCWWASFHMTSTDCCFCPFFEQRSFHSLEVASSSCQLPLSARHRHHQRG